MLNAQSPRITRIPSKAKAPDCSGAFAVAGCVRRAKEPDYLLPLFGAAMLLAPEPALSGPDGLIVPFLFAPLRMLDPVVMLFSCCVFLPDEAPGLTVP